MNRDDFITADQGNQTARVWVGFGLGGSELRMRIQASQGRGLVAAAETATSSSLKPGILLGIGSAVATGSAAGLAVGAAETGMSRSFLESADTDAKRTANEVAKQVHAAHVGHDSHSN